MLAEEEVKESAPSDLRTMATTEASLEEDVPLSSQEAKSSSPSTAAAKTDKEDEPANAAANDGTVNNSKAPDSSRLRRLKSTVARKFKSAKHQFDVWFHKKVLPRFPESIQAHVLKFESTVARLYENYWRFMTMPETQKLLIVTLFFCAGATGFCVSSQFIIDWMPVWCLNASMY